MVLLNPKTDDEWDGQMKDDAVAGKFNELINEADAERRARTLRDFPKP